VLYVFDRNFPDFDFLKRLLAKDNHFVLRVRDAAPATRTVRTLPLTAEDAETGVVSDQIFTLGGWGAPPGECRLLVIQTTNHKGEREVIRLLTSLAGQRRTVGAV
jgi:hypothetical protein